MARQQKWSLFVFACVIALGITSVADAQRRHHFRRGGILSHAPLVRVQVGPYGGVSVRAPLVAVDPGGVHVGLRRRHAPLPQHTAPQPAARPYQPAPAAAQLAPTAPVDSRPFPTTEQIAAMDDVMLLATLREMNDRLDARLTRFDTGQGWRRYLRIPESSLGATASGDPTIQLDVLQQKLTHFHNVASNPEFAKIARLSSFVATHLALDQVIHRFGGPQLIQPQQPGAPRPAENVIRKNTEKNTEKREEILPTPTPAVAPKATLGERSILRRASRN